MSQWKTLATDEVIKKTIDALKVNGINAIVVDNGQEAMRKALEIIPERAEVMTMTSVTNETIGLTDAIDRSGKYNSVRSKLNKMDRKTDSLQMQKLGAAPEYATGSVHAMTQAGQLMIASNTGSQLAAYVYGSAHIIWVVGTQKIVENLDAGTKRIYDYVLPLESMRARKAYNLPDTWNSNPSKILIINKEVNPTRLTIILVKEVLGF